MAKKRKDWRKRPRKPAHLKRDRQLPVRVTTNEYRQIQAAAKDAGRTMADWVVIECLGRHAR